MRISIVIATFNRAALLQETLEHLRRQAYEPGDEVIVVDNGSTDRTPEVIGRAADGFPARFVRMRETTPGKTPALNTGIAVAGGDILALTDDDVLVADDWVATIRRVFRESSVDLIGGRVEPRWESPGPRWLQVEENGRYGALASPLALLHYGDAQELGDRTAVGANLVVRQSVLRALGGFTPHLGRRSGTLLCGEDHDFCQRAVAAGYRCEYRPEVSVRHWVPADRMRLAYYLRWFFWSGVTQGMLERGTREGTRTVPLYLVRRLLTAPMAALAHLLGGRLAAAAAAIVDGAYVLGNISQRVRDRLRAGRLSYAASGEDAASVPSPPSARAGKRPTAVNPAGVEQR
jgi:glucosyl-dolichyl phosphate glucuronosyltransferase